MAFGEAFSRRAQRERIHSAKRVQGAGARGVQRLQGAGWHDERNECGETDGGVRSGTWPWGRTAMTVFAISCAKGEVENRRSMAC